MPANVIKERRRGCDPKKFTQQQEDFCLYLLADPTYNVSAAARRAGYKNPGQAGKKLMSHPGIKAYLGKEKAERVKRKRKTIDDLVDLLENAATFNPCKFFLPSPDGGWLIDKKELKNLPDYVGMLIEEITEKKVTTETSEVTMYCVKLINRTKMTEMWGKHLGAFEQDNLQKKTGIDWDSMPHFKVTSQVRVDVVEQRIADPTKIVQVEETPKGIPYALDEFTEAGE